MRILIRADASTVTGTGHVMRCLALAQALPRAGGAVMFAQIETTAALQTRLAAEKFVMAPITAAVGGPEDAAQTIALARAHAADWVVADGYQFNAAFQQSIHAAGLRLLLITDLPFAGPIAADLLLNQNLPVRPADYPQASASTRLLLGPRYVVLRREFNARPDRPHEIREPGRRVLITLGGSDPANITGRLLDALGALPDIEITVVIGGSNPHRADLEARRSCAPAPGRLRCITDAPDMPALMDWADLALAAGGSTSWELARLGVPAGLVVLAENQAAVAARLQEEQAAVFLGTAADLDPGHVACTVGALLADADRRRKLSERASRLVDGLGVHRVLASLQAARLQLRPAAPADCRLVWEWANAPEMRAASFNSDLIPWADHVRWFEARLADPAVLFLLSSLDRVFVGQIRFEPGPDGAVVSVGLAPGQRGRGLGPALIRAGCDRLFAAGPVRRIHAYTRPGNLASVRAFEKAGFACQGPAHVGTHAATHLVLDREYP